MDLMDDIIVRALREDIGDGDHTSLACIPETAQGSAILRVKEAGILAGVDVAKRVFSHVDADLEFMPKMQDGMPIKPGDVVFEVKGSSRSILKGERLALNFMQRMSGIATHTRRIADLLSGTKTKLLDTRKTTPNFRLIEKMAVKIGGGENHRFGLYDMMMIKDNHIDFAGGIPQAIDAAHDYLQNTGKTLAIEIEVRNFDELSQALEKGGFQRIMLDNFSPSDLKKAIDRIAGRYETEASGGITEQTIRQFAETGVDYISVGALTHQIRSLDLSLVAV
ncbi:MAG: carboxylating nicotinate-nucleotide diphosphorylase [Bacteroidales bacterium]|jgi:nicotinate-nucleotide pyrophosphorylase (carboxylating)|nr:carboxylating nicotinate-nucleotide diphosphorylase [Bacteroidales bacterium]